jgi:uncharacterized membrane protein YqjE
MTSTAPQTSAGSSPPDGGASKAPSPTTAPEPGSDEPIGALVHRLTQQIPELIRAEMKLAQAELTEKGKSAGIGIGLFSAAGLTALYGLAALLTTIVVLLDLALPLWLSALIVTVVLFAIAGVAALVGKKQVSQATPPAPERAIAGVKEDVATVKGQRS